ncbi:phage tail tape measure protein [Bacillus sp. AG4(2022)]|uniref:phage tail tape measure protein n=1 Tax=Bacillus sp. AG4(2022) TaxID=2962594 RepID=UPI0028823CA1|nr:phage tail tape measure protein [Bacillus sp. AG4(2022)]MDT0160262.1 phage tail tape measure protein [Bacillus sp. AG4(2022)]
MSNDLRILVTASLNINQSTQEINKKIREIEGKIKPIKIKVELDHSSLAGLQSQLSQFGNMQHQAAASTQQTTSQIQQMTQATNQAATSTASFGQQLNIALSRTAIWTAATTAIFGTVKMVRLMTQEVLLVDSAMTELKRVMDEAPVTFNELLTESIQLSKELGNNVHDVLQAINGFARAGEYTKKQLMDLAKTATVASNVSDLSPEEAMNNMISTMNVYKIQAEETMSIIDKMNEVDNNFAVSTKQISEAMAKASGVAASFGVSIDELIGDITSISSVTFESGSIIGRALKTIYSRITTMKPAENILNSIGISIKNAAGDSRDVSDILSDLRVKWSTLSKSQQENISVTLAGRDQLTRFIALMRSADIAIDATNTAMNSHGSAMKENEKYLQSMAAQLNILKSSFTEMSVAVGANGLGQSFMAIVKSLTFMMNGFSAFTETTKGLNIILPLVALSIYGVSKAFIALKAAATGAKLSLGWIGLGVIALEGLATASFGASKAYGESVDTFIEAAEKSSQSADRLEELAAKYEELKPHAENNSKAQKELSSVLDEINRIAPNVIENTDKYGNSLTINKDKVDQFANSLRKMSDEQLKSATAQLNIDLSDAKNELDSLKVKMSEQKDEISGFYDTMIAYQEKYNVISLVDAAKEYQKRTANLSGKALREAADEYGQYNLIMNKHSSDMKEYSKTLDDVNNKEAQVEDLEKRQKQVEFLTSGYQSLSKSIQETFNGQLGSSLYSDLDEEQLKALIKFGNAYKNNKDNVSEYTSILQEASLTQEQITAITDRLAESTLQSAEGMEASAEAAEFASSSLEEFKSAAEMAVGASQNSIDTTYEMAKVYQLLSNQESLSEAQKYALAEATSFLSSTYPHLIKGSEMNIDAMLNEARTNNVLIKAVEAAANGQLTAQQESTLASALNTKARIENIKAEVKAQKSLLDSFASIGDKYTKMYEEGKISADDYARAMMRVGDLSGEPFYELDKATQELDNLSDSINTTSLELAQIPAINDKVSSSTEKVNKTTEESVYITDKYKQSLESVRLELEKQEAIKAKFPSYSKQYQNALKSEIALMEKQKKLMQDQAKSLKSQIDSGIVKQTGIIKGTAASSYTGKYANEINKAASTYGVDPYLIAAMIQAESSFNPNARSSAGAQGLMQLMPSTAKSLGVKNAYDPLDNIMGGTKYIAQQIEKFGGDIRKALWAYNAGAGNVSKILNSGANSWKGVKSYADKILAQFGQTNAAISSASQSVADYYLSNFRQTSQFGSQESFRSKPHQGLDLSDGKSGSVIKSLQSGKVITATYSKSAGNWVVVQNDDGTVAKYMHMLKTPEVKAGQRVEAGQRIGQVGNTGDSRGAHLHLQIEQDGKAIDPKQYLESLKIGQSVAEQMQSIDGAKSDLTSLQAELLNLEAEIAQKNFELLKLPIDIFEKRIRDQDNNIQNTTNSLYNLSEGTSEYGFKLRQLIAYYKEKQTQNEKEINYMRQLIASGKLSAVQVAEVSEQLQGLIDRRYEIAQGRDEINAQIVTNALHKYAKAIEDVNYNLELSRSIQELYVEGSEKYNAETVNQSKLLREKQKLIVDEINKLDELLKKQDLSIESSEEYSNQLKQLKLDLQNLNNELNRSLVDQLSKLRDKQIEGINDYYDTLIERQEERLNQLDEEIEKEDRLQKLREIDDEISKVKNDKRFSYITSEGKEILTYNQERVSELEKQRNEMLEQYQREDLKKAINDEIDRLRKAKDDIVRNEEEKWKSVLESAQNGTLNLDSFMQQWYGMNLDVMGDYATQLNSQVSVIKEIFKSLASIKVSLPGVPGLNGSDNPFGMSEADFNKYVQNKKTYESGASGASKAAIENQKLREKYDVGTDNFNYDQLKKYHDGGVVGQSHGSRLAEMVNRLGNHKLKPGELFTKSLVGEVQIPPKNFSNLFANIGTLMNSLTPNVPSIVSPQGDTYHIHNATIKADNPSELWKGIQMQTRMNRK